MFVAIVLLEIGIGDQGSGGWGRDVAGNVSTCHPSDGHGLFLFIVALR
jgi:hypothetical protein